MAARWTPRPAERMARRYRRAARREDRLPRGRYGRAGFGYPEGFRGAYAERPGYYATRGDRYHTESMESGWPSPLYRANRHSEERHRRAYRDRELARSVDAALYDLLGPEVDRIAIYADDAVITLRGMVSDPDVAADAVRIARRIPGVYRVNDDLVYWYDLMEDLDVGRGEFRIGP